MTRVAIIGCGFWGLEHLACYLELDDLEISVCDMDRERAETAALRAETDRCYTDYRELLAKASPELVSVCTMPGTHREISIAALETGSNVLCEKPMADSIENAKAMVEAAERATGFLTIGYEIRYSPRARYIKEFIDSGRLGRAVYVRCWLLADFPWAYKTTVSLDSVHASIVKSKRGGGTVSAGGVHAIDLAMWMAGSPTPLNVSAAGAQMFPRKRGASAPSAEIAELYDVDDLATAFIRFDDGTWMVHEAAHGGFDRIDPENTRDTAAIGFVIVGEDATISFAPFQILHNDEQGNVVDVTPSEMLDWGFRGSLNAELSEVVAAVRNGTAPLVHPAEALQVEQIKGAIERSMSANRELPFEG